MPGTPFVGHRRPGSGPDHVEHVGNGLVGRADDRALRVRQVEALDRAVVHLHRLIDAGAVEPVPVEDLMREGVEALERGDVDQGVRFLEE